MFGCAHSVGWTAEHEALFMRVRRADTGAAVVAMPNPCDRGNGEIDDAQCGFARITHRRHPPCPDPAIAHGPSMHAQAAHG